MDFKEQMELIKTYNCRISILYSNWAKQHGLSYSTMMILYAIKKSQPCTQKQIVEEWMIPKQTVNTVMKALYQQGYIEYAEGRNQKEKLISFTMQGEKVIADFLQETERLEEKIFARVGQESCKVITAGMKQFADIMEEELEENLIS